MCGKLKLFCFDKVSLVTSLKCWPFNLFLHCRCLIQYSTNCTLICSKLYCPEVFQCAGETYKGSNFYLEIFTLKILTC